MMGVLHKRRPGNVHAALLLPIANCNGRCVQCSVKVYRAACSQWHLLLLLLFLAAITAYINTQGEGRSLAAD